MADSSKTERSSPSFDLVFSGQIVPGADPQKARDNATKLFRASPQQLEKLFSGAAIVLKNNVDEITAEIYQDKLKAAGLICTICPQGSQPDDTATQTTATQAAAATAQVGATSVEQTIAQRVEHDIPDWSVAPIGEDVNPHDPEPAPPTPDTSHLALKEQKGYLFEQDDTPAPPAPDTSHLTLKE